MLIDTQAETSWAAECDSAVPGFSRLKLEVSDRTGLPNKFDPFSKGVKIPLWDVQLGSRTVQLQKPVSVDISKGEDCFCAENETLHIYEVADSPATAVQAFRDTLAYFCEYYRKLPVAKATADARRLKSVFMSLLK